MIYCMHNLKEGNHAGAKAPNDIFEIALSLRCEEFIFYNPETKKNIFLTRLFAIPVGLNNWIRFYRTASVNDAFIIQHPYENITIARWFVKLLKRRKNIEFVSVVHDLNSIRKSLSQNGNSLRIRNEIADEKLLKDCDYIICHNEKMKEYMKSKGYNENQLICLEVFDYLYDGNCQLKRNRDNGIVVAGNLTQGKCEYIYKLCKENVLSCDLHLYGPGYSGENERKNIIYHGVCKPEELPQKMEGSFGLVWDGTEIDRCAGNAGEYIRYNNPHKCSLYIASNLPVIIWKEAALAQFVEKNHIGITVNSIFDIDEAINKVSDEEYNMLCENTRRVGEKMRQGYYFRTALNKTGIFDDTCNMHAK